MRWVKDYWVTIIISLSLVLLVDLVVGKTLLDTFVDSDRIEQENVEKSYRIADPIFHHTLASNYDGPAYWGGEKYRVCTNALGFKSYCGDQATLDTKFDILFIGDSVTEAVGMEFEESFVGLISKAFPDLSIGNMGVSSYSPSVYFSKIRYFVDKGLNVGHVVVYVDISDIQDESRYVLEGDRVVEFESQEEDANRGLYSKARNFLEEYLPLTYRGLRSLRRYVTAKRDRASRSHLSVHYGRSAWTTNPTVSGYGIVGIDGAVDRAVANMAKLHEYLKSRDIKLSVGVYPWPGQLLHDSVDSRQVTVWREFCRNRCEFFIESFSELFAMSNNMSPLDLIDEIYIQRDIHFNKFGNRIIADDFTATYESRLQE